LSAAERVAGLLTPEAEAAATERSGVLDVLGPDGDAEVGGTSAQRLMLTRALPEVYERYWRPALGRSLKGTFGPGMAEEQRIARLLLGLTPGDGVLDVACGPGNFTRGFARTVGDTGLATGIDASATMLGRAVRDTPRTLRNVAYVRGDAADLPFRDASFDAVCCFAAMYLFADPWAALDSMARVVTPGGRIAILTSCLPRSGTGRALGRLVGERMGGVRMFDRDEIVDGLEARGFADARLRVTGLAQFVGARKRRA
jgi:SAM-dependent methyltransferase